MKSIRLKNMSRVYGRRFALHRVNVEFRAGELTVILGHNGAGKTTLMNILATVDQPTKGTVNFDTTSFSAFAKSRRDEIGWVSHEALLYNDLSGRENLNFFASMYGVDKTIVQTWLDRVDLLDVADDRVSTYSRGMRQRISIARAMVQNPSLILLDEPLTGLDPISRRRMLELFDELKRDGKILVMITHDVSIPDQFVDRVLLLKDGKVAFDGTRPLANVYAEFSQ